MSISSGTQDQDDRGDELDDGEQRCRSIPQPRAAARSTASSDRRARATEHRSRREARADRGRRRNGRRGRARPAMSRVVPRDDVLRRAPARTAAREWETMPVSVEEGQHRRQQDEPGAERGARHRQPRCRRSRAPRGSRSRAAHAGQTRTTRSRPPGRAPRAVPARSSRPGARHRCPAAATQTRRQAPRPRRMRRFQSCPGWDSNPHALSGNGF